MPRAVNWVVKRSEPTESTEPAVETTMAVPGEALVETWMHVAATTTKTTAAAEASINVQQCNSALSPAAQQRVCSLHSQAKVPPPAS